MNLIGKRPIGLFRRYLEIGNGRRAHQSRPSLQENAAPSALAKACAKDVESVCGDVKPGGSNPAACMKEHFSDLSTDCQIPYVKVAAVGRACKADMKKFCANVKPGSTRSRRNVSVADGARANADVHHGELASA